MNRTASAFLVILITGIMALHGCGSDDNTVTPDPQPHSIQRDGSMLLIAARGKQFLMGSATGHADEQPLHSVTLSRNYWMDSTEITQGLYDRIMKQRYPAYLAPPWTAMYGLGADYPAYLVEWGDAVLFCNARSESEGLEPVYSYTAIIGTPGNGCRLENPDADLARNGYRLPTEAEWEYACRSGVASDYSWGRNHGAYPLSTADSLEFASHAVWGGNSWYLSSDHADFGTARVASRKPNAFGLYDMHGNLWEWCHDWYDPDYYSNAPALDPAGPPHGDWHSLRGGSWGNDAVHLRSSNREFSAPDYLFYFIGFRTVRPAH